MSCRVILGFVVLLLPACVAGDRGSGAPDEPALVLAAASLRGPLEELAATGDPPVTLVFGASGSLAAQVRSGAPADLFLPAEPAFAGALVREGLAADSGLRRYGVGRVALVWRDGFPEPGDLRELAGPEVRTLALANPELAPYGAAGRAVLQALGIWDDLSRRVVYGENVAHALQFVRTGNAEVGLVALSLVSSPGGGPHRVVPDSLHPPLLQVGLLLDVGANPAGGRAFLERLAGPEGAEILRRHGFEPLGTPVP